MERPDDHGREAAHGGGARGAHARARLGAHRPRVDGAPRRRPGRRLRHQDAAEPARDDLAPEARLLTVQPFDRASSATIERAIIESDLGLTPNNDGKIIRLPIPQLTEERRKELVQGSSQKMAEEVRVAVRNVRRDVLNEMKRAEKDGEFSARRAEAAPRRTSRSSPTTRCKSIDELMKRKEAEIIEVETSARRHGDAAHPTAHRAAGRLGRATAGAAEPTDDPRVHRDHHGRERALGARRGLPVAGHRAGARALKKVVRGASTLASGPDRLLVLHRELDPAGGEVATSWSCSRRLIDREVAEPHEERVRMRFIGRLDELNRELRARIAASRQLRPQRGPEPVSGDRTTAAGKRSSTPRGASWPRAGPTRARPSSPSPSTRPTCATRARHPHERRAAHHEFPAAGSAPTPSCTSAAAVAGLRREASRPRSPSTGAAIGASAGGEGARSAP